MSLDIFKTGGPLFTEDSNIYIELDSIIMCVMRLRSWQI